ncbi:hypothetical protein R69658_05431 [Paraburkholderia aspalathi]|uniref:Uncharacterized protein n=1 Tax=Paraburkholderia aspalathi TaxID=1324617 RepID=A0ABM8SIE6_9BURK|nr:hypothetical protein R69658_05431 [Paraburkholderia aspalathi]
MKLNSPRTGTTSISLGRMCTHRRKRRAAVYPLVHQPGAPTGRTASAGIIPVHARDTAGWRNGSDAPGAPRKAFNGLRPGLLCCREYEAWFRFDSSVKVVGPVLHHLAALGQELGVHVRGGDLVALRMRKLPIDKVAAVAELA